MTDLTICPREDCTATERHWHTPVVGWGTKCSCLPDACPHTGLPAGTSCYEPRPQADLTERHWPLAFEAYTLANFFGVPVEAIAAGDLNFGDIVATPTHQPVDVRGQQVAFRLRDVNHEALQRLFHTKPVSQPPSDHHTATPKEEPTMKKSDLLARELSKALAEEARIEEQYGPDQEDGAVIAFRVQFAARGVWYEYAAIRVKGAWFTTGPRSPKAYTWEELTGWLDGAHRVSKIKTLRKGRKSKKET